jgi:prepilin-type N-terminal cleavage/methylation domain-containing protein
MTRRGGTLVEMLITMVLLGVIASVATLAIRRVTLPSPSDPMTIIADTMNGVIQSGRPATLQFIINGRPAIATLNPDGSVFADTALHVDRFTGEVRGRSGNAH